MKPATVGRAHQSVSLASKLADHVRVRMYRHGLGDCFLLRLPRDNGDTFNILIDCGIISVAKKPKPTMSAVVADINLICRGRLDLVVLTHEHWDHVSGFSTTQVQSAFDQLQIDEVWYAWTENPDNSLGQKLRNERTSKLRALNRAVTALRATGTQLAMRRAERVLSLLSFFGGSEPTALSATPATTGKTRLAFEYLGARPGIRRRYCHPKDDPSAFPGVPGIRVYILGPPENEGLIKRSSPTKNKEAYEFSGDLAIDDNLSAAFERLTATSNTDEKDCPFDTTYSRKSPEVMVSGSSRLRALIEQTWNGDRWRQIEDDWTAAAETLALNLDTHTNNTCLVLAFELIESGKVLLFAADAQIGNWLSWQDTAWRVADGGTKRRVTGPDLLGRTVFYKVGHHGSHNATLRALGLEQMTSNELMAFVPVFKSQALKNRWNGMPFLPLVKRLGEKTGGRIVFSDIEVDPPSEKSLQALSEDQGKDFVSRLIVDELYYEYTFDL